MAAELRAMLGLAPSTAWTPPVVLTNACTGDGVPALAEVLDKHQAYLHTEGRMAAWRQRHTAFHIASLARRRVLAQADRQLAADGLLDRLAGWVQAGAGDPYRAAAEALAVVMDAKERPSS
jgi:LAO/AO transport system kinase